MRWNTSIQKKDQLKTFPGESAPHRFRAAVATAVSVCADGDVGGDGGGKELALSKSDSARGARERACSRKRGRDTTHSWEIAAHVAARGLSPVSWPTAIRSSPERRKRKRRLRGLRSDASLRPAVIICLGARDPAWMFVLHHVCDAFAFVEDCTEALRNFVVLPTGALSFAEKKLGQHRRNSVTTSSGAKTAARVRRWDGGAAVIEDEASTSVFHSVA
ncbi:hypothetical protein HPB51_022369 [Rhipicephalus microplus]|uniref:Uncharacterized protein n=1 Tax=Rhipicephalus microplus TaxID=6941 RepID=A0A9J6DQX0_RHIMP|nr:hypothetical protein HPB51_022369 [Rhipicephalus microplus]